MKKIILLLALPLLIPILFLLCSPSFINITINEPNLNLISKINK